MATAAIAKRAAAIDVVVFRVDDMVCGMDILDIQEIKRIHAHAEVHRAPRYVRGLVNMRGHIVTLVDVGQRLGLPPRPLRRAAPAIVVSLGDELVGLLVDEIDDVVTADPSDIVPAPGNLGGVEGHFLSAVMRTDGGLVAIVDKDRIAGVDAASDRREGHGS